MPDTFERIGSAMVPKGGQHEIVFNNIPQNYTDIKILMSIRSNVTIGQTGTSQYDSFTMWVNNNFTAADYGGRNFYTFNSGPNTVLVGGETQTTSRQIGFIQGGLSTQNAFGNCEIYIPAYSANNIEKNLCVQTSNVSHVTGCIMSYAVNKYNSTSPITSIGFRMDWGNAWVEGSYVTMYGIRKA